MSTALLLLLLLLSSLPSVVPCPKNIRRFSIHIDEHPQSPNITFIRSPIFAIILQTIRNSSYYNPESNSACLHLAPVDTIDRDRRSKHGHYLSFIEQHLNFFPEWSDPEKIHLVFNHYTGTWPRYDRQLDFRLPPRSILISPSFSTSTYSSQSHLSFPLFHADYPRFVPHSSPSRTILLSFKGKSYGDVEHHRTFFRHLHNGRDIIIEYTDENRNSSFDYVQLLVRSHFCLVPSGRRLASYRFLESLQYGCIPVITTENDESIVLPFSELIPWSEVLVIAINRSLSLLPYHLRQISSIEREKMRQSCSRIWKTYFSSIPRIVLTAIDLLSRRFSQSR